MKLAKSSLVTIMILFMLIHTASAKFTPKTESVVIHEYPTDSDFIKIYTASKSNVSALIKSIGLPVKNIEVREEDGYTVFTVDTSLGERIGVFERRISGETLKGLSSLGEVYIYINKGCVVKGDVELIESEEFQNLYRVVGYSDITYRLQSEPLHKLLIPLLVIPVVSFAFSRVYAKRVFLSDLSREEKVYKMRKLMIFLPIPLALFIAFLMIAANAIVIYAMIMGYFFSYNEMLFAIGFISIFLVSYALSLISVILGYLPYYKELKREEIKPKKAAKSVILIITMSTLPMLIWVALLINLPKSIASKTEFTVLLFVVFVFALMSISPNLVSLFHRAERFEGPLKDEIIEFCKKCGVNVSDVKIIKDLPERVANAGVSGILHKYVFLTDCLLEKFTKEELMAVIAHEIGHLKEKHNLISGLFTIAFFVIWMLVSGFIDFSSMGFYGFMVIWSAVLLAFSVLFGRIMVYLEFRADRYAAKVVGKDVYVKALSKLAEINVMKRKTGKLFNILTFHPSIEERINKVIKVIGD